MLTHLTNLLVRAMVGFPTVISGNWLSILLPLAPYVLVEFPKIRRGWPEMSAGQKQAFFRDTRILAVTYALLFGLAVAKTVYQDHEDLVHKIGSLKPPQELDAQILDVSPGGANHDKDGIVVVLMKLNNNDSERPRPISNWKVQVSLDSVLISQSPMALPGPEWKIPMPNGQMILEEAKYCPVVTENPLPGGANRECWLIARFNGKGNAMDASQFKVVVSFYDGLSRKSQTLDRIVLPK